MSQPTPRPALPVIDTERLHLRPLREDDADALHSVFSDAEVMTYWSSGPHQSREQTRAYVRGNVTGDVYSTWAMGARGGDDTALGWVVLHHHRKGLAEIGYVLRRDHWGRGLTREAVAAVLEHAFTAVGYRRIKADVDPDNAGSNRLLEALGFTREGVLRGEWETHIGVRDSVIWGLLRDEWAERARASSR
ncbi:GNAT family N-acetyltransferase [Haliangium ochraceum]|nr:GNAT family N-acetyltransferase [Haliangium ochraceum]